MFLERRGEKSFIDTVVYGHVGLSAYYAAYPLKKLFDFLFEGFVAVAQIRACEKSVHGSYFRALL